MYNKQGLFPKPWKRIWRNPSCRYQEKHKKSEGLQNKCFCK